MVHVWASVCLKEHVASRKSYAPLRAYSKTRKHISWAHPKYNLNSCGSWKYLWLFTACQHVQETFTRERESSLHPPSAFRISSGSHPWLLPEVAQGSNQDQAFAPSCLQFRLMRAQQHNNSSHHWTWTNCKWPHLQRRQQKAYDLPANLQQASWDVNYNPW